MAYFAAVLLAALFLGPPAYADRKLCDHVILKEGFLRLSANERVLVCGSDKSQDGWRQVPLEQAQAQLTVILQNQGYMSPRYERRGDNLIVRMGKPSLVKIFAIIGADGILDGSRKRRVIGQRISPELLDEVSSWAESQLRNRGFPCPQVIVKAQVWDGKIVLNVETGPRLRIRHFSITGLDGLDSSIVRRYKAFQEGEWYDARDTQLTTGRMMSDGLFESALISSSCHADGVDLQMTASVGRPRLLRFGVGASTEEFPFLDLGFRNSRLDAQASSMQTVLHASPRLQSLMVGAELYILPWSTRTYFSPRWNFSRTDEQAYEVLSSKAGADLARRWDLWHMRWLASLGPTLNYVNTVRGIGPSETYYVSWDGSLEMMSHIYEFGVRQQFEGWHSNFTYRGQREGIGAPLTVDRYQLGLKYLWNIGSFSPPAVVLATRVDGIAVDANADDLSQGRDLLPTDYRIYYGGDANLRGFSRQSLNNGGLGYLTAVGAGAELRFTDQLPFRIEPFLLYDVAKLGRERFKTDDPTLISSGLGLRWASPIGTVRATAARGEIIGKDFTTREYPEEWVYFFSFGQEF